VDIVYLDFAKAFDKVPTKKLLAKIKAKGIKGKVYNWIAEWLNKRKQRVLLNGQHSEWLDVISGVPQGSVLGPLLFLIFIDDLDNFSPMISILSKFADDTKLGHPVINEEDKNILQNQLNQLCEWTEQWGMQFNVSKCKVMHIGSKNQSFDYTMNGENLSKVTSEKDVGITFESTLKPGLYCKEAARIAKGILNQISRSFHFRDKKVFLDLYKRYVRVHLEFATPVWSPWQTGDINILEKVQQKAVSMIAGLQGSDYEAKLKELKLLSLVNRRNRADMIQLFKIVNNIDSVEAATWFQVVNITRPNTRAINHNNGVINFHIPVKRTEISKNFFSVRAAIYWNNLPDNVKQAQTLPVFKKRLDKYLETLA
jgi:ribonucleases P/MRP protein subunit RPP40